jgi:uncharacterized iron-regulated membrane protein
MVVVVVMVMVVGVEALIARRRCDGDAPGRPPPTARHRRQRPPGMTTTATAATPGILGAQVGKSLLVVLALDMLGLLRGEWRVGRSRLVVEIRG